MRRAARSWLGVAEAADHTHDRHHDHGHGHTHGVIDPTIATTARGIWAIKWSFVILAITSLMQLVIVALSGSVALLADTIHNLAMRGPRSHFGSRSSLPGARRARALPTATGGSRIWPG